MSASGFDHAANELLADLADIAEGVLITNADMNADTARMLAIEIAMQVSSEWGGHNVYIPRGNKINVVNRDAQVYEMFNGNNIPEVASYFGISEQWAYRIVDRQRKREKDKRQRNLF